jgi:membrane fusion protein, copper/silver efflux system
LRRQDAYDLREEIAANAAEAQGLEMKRACYIGIIAVLLVGSFLAGSWYTHRDNSTNAAPGGRKVLYYVDPMHPAYKSDKPGIAPDCGMELVPVYEDGSLGGSGGSPGGTPSGTVQINSDRQQMIGIKVAQVERKPPLHAVRALGRVASDEARLYRINSSTDMWIRKVFAPTTGSFVRRDAPLMAFYSTNFLTAASSYMFALSTLDRFKGAPNSQQDPTFNYQVRQAIDALENLGVSQTQIKEMEKTRKPSDLVDVRSPTDGIVLARNISLGQWVGPGTELYRVANLSQVWIFANFFENETALFKPGMQVRVSAPTLGRTFPARVSNVLPEFDAAARTMRVRLEADNPGYVLRPDMFVDIEIPVSLPPAITVPVDAVVDSGVKKTVYVVKGDGIFEPRKVETGWRAGGQAEIVKGLVPGERIVVSGTFLIDSESRMKTAAAGIYGESSEDPACGVEVDQSRARVGGLTSELRGQIYYFSSVDCKNRFDAEPAKYAATSGKPTRSEAAKPTGGIQPEVKKSKGQDSARSDHSNPQVSAPVKSSSR